MKNPNGYGTVVKLSGNRRRPYTARKTAGWNEKGHPIYLTIGYYATREEGLIALAEFNRDPYDVNRARMTLRELYDLWLKNVCPRLGKSLQVNLKSAYQHIQALGNARYRDIRSLQMQDTIDRCGHGYATQATIKNLWRYLDRLAMEMDIINRMFSALTTAAPIEETTKHPFSEDEIALLWEHKDDPWVDTILIMIYSGWRISEFCTLKVENIDLNQNTMNGGMKTKSGKGRVVPIHSRILPLVQKRLLNGTEFLIINERGKPFSACTFRRKFEDTLQKYGISHTPHETRHTFRTRLDAAGANKRCIDLMMGHKSKEVGERIYTHKTIEDLRAAVELITL